MSFSACRPWARHRSKALKGTLRHVGSYWVVSSGRRLMHMASKSLPIAAFAATLIFGAGGAFANEPKSDQPVTDTMITTKVKTELAKDDTTKARHINVTTKDGVVRLSGMVDSATEKQKAEEDAKTIEGVVSVDNQLTVKR
jgi:hyperosmotically inducible periplasmic protein